MLYLIPIFFLINGFLLKYEVYHPVVFRGSANEDIAMGIIFLIAIPFFKKWDKGDEDSEKLEKNKNNFICNIIYVFGIVILGFNILNIFTNDWIFVLAILSMAFCQTIIKFFSYPHDS